MIMETNNLKYVIVDGCGYIELAINKEIAQICYHSGDCLQDSMECIKLPAIAEQFKNIDNETLKKCLSECGEFDEMITMDNREEMEAAVLFVAACNFIDEEL